MCCRPRSRAFSALLSSVPSEPRPKGAVGGHLLALQYLESCSRTQAEVKKSREQSGTDRMQFISLYKKQHCQGMEAAIVGAGRICGREQGSCVVIADSDMNSRMPGVLRPQPTVVKKMV